MRYSCILFDFDGVLAKTMEDNCRAWQKAFSNYQVKMNKEKYFLLEGMSTQAVAAYFLPKKLNTPAIIAEIVAEKENQYLLNNNFAFYPGVLKLLAGLRKAKYRLGLVSGANYGRLSKTLSKKFLKQFESIVTGDRLKKGKPNPQPYRQAMRDLQVGVKECVAIENAPLGIQSAKRAGLYCVAVTSTLHKRYLRKADLIISEIKKLEDLFLKAEYNTTSFFDRKDN